MRRFLLIAAQLAVLLVFIRVFQMEPGSGIQRILVLLFAGFVANAALPLRARLPFFLFLSFLAIGVVIGFVPALMVITAGLTMICIAHLPVPFALRVALVVFVAALLIALRSGWAPIEGTAKIAPLALPVLGSMFMFRMIVYLYDLRLEERSRKKTGASSAGRANLWARLSYFFLLPNVCFLIFPVVDYRLFRRTYYDTDANAIYQRGVSLVALGLVYLLAYRFVYHYIALAPDQVHGIEQLAQFTTATYLVVLRLVGQFHIAIGILCLFGFHLPPANHFIFLASSFTDFWRRVRIDWKDFVLKIFYYPLFLPLQRRVGVTLAIVFATVAAFAATWFLHSVQWFWLRGDFLVSSADVVFWSVFGGCVLVNSLIEASRKRKRLAQLTAGGAIVHAGKIVGMFVFLSILWSYWTSPTARDWLTLMSAARGSGWRDYVAVLAVIAAIIGVLAGAQLMGMFGARKPTTSTHVAQRPVGSTWQIQVATTIAFGALIIAHLSGLQSDSRSIRAFAATMSSSRLNKADQAELTRGYYETLLDVGSSSLARLSGEGAGQIEKLNAEEGVATTGAATTAAERNATAEGLSAPEPITKMDFVTHSKSLLAYGLKPSYSGSYRGAPFTTNRWGMRDKDYSLAPPPDTYRIALLGGSYEMASGVPAEKGFEALLEDRLNRDAVPPSRFEILNFAVGGYDVMQAFIVAEEQVFRFSPNAVALGIEALATERTLDHLIPLVRFQSAIPYPYILKKYSEARVQPSMTRAELRARLRPVTGDVVRWSLERIATSCRKHGVPAFLFLIPRTQADETDAAELSQIAKWAKDAGFIVIDATNAYGSLPSESVWISSFDQHPNARGHQMIADAIYAQLSRNGTFQQKLASSSRR